MYKPQLLSSLAISATLILAACSSNDDDANPSTGSQFNPNAEQSVDDGAGGGDTTPIAGLWDGTIQGEETDDVVYWNLSETGVLTRYDFQQDGVESASGENCYVVGDPISVDPEDGDTFSFFNVNATAAVNEGTLTITFLEADKNDLNENGDTTETPTLSWPSLDTPSLEDLNACTDTGEGQSETAETDGAETVPTDGDQTEPTDGMGAADGGGSDGGDGLPMGNSDADRTPMTSAECATAGGIVVGDIGDGAIHREEYRCESGMAPIGRITFDEGEPTPIEGAVCCI